MIKIRIRISILICSFLMVFCGCASFFENLRRSTDDSDGPDFEADSPRVGATEGGRWQEREYLSKSNRGRSLASVENPNNSRENRQGFRQSDNRQEDLQDYQRSVLTPISTSTVSNIEPQSKRLYKDNHRATKDDFVDQSQEEGSLWASSGQTNYYFTKNRIRSPGDLISLTIDGDLYRDVGAEIKRSLTPNEWALELVVAQEKIRKKFLANLGTSTQDKITTSAAVPQKSGDSSSTPKTAEGTKGEAAKADADSKEGAKESSTVSGKESKETDPGEIEKLIPRVTLADVDIFASLELKSGETMMGEILERYPNGNYRIRTVKKVSYKNGSPRTINVIGIVKGSDINEETDLINAGKLYEYRVEAKH